MHGLTETSKLPRTVWTVGHFLIVCLAAWLYFGGGIASVGSWIGQSWPAGDMGRRMLLLSFAIALWIRMTFTAHILLARRFDWTECLGVLGAVGFYQFGFAFTGAMASAELSPVDLIAVGFFGLGGYLNTGSEIQRKRFKDNPANKGKLYTKGLFSLVRHPNYLGDIFWALGWALLTRNAWALLVPAVAAAGFTFVFIPELSTYLSKRYGPQFEPWENRTKRLVPFIY